jgi:hypothetical protein
LIADADGNVREIFYDDNGRQTGTRFYHYPTDQRPPAEASGIVHPASAYPPKRTRLETKNVLDASGSVLTSFTTESCDGFAGVRPGIRDSNRCQGSMASPGSGPGFGIRIEQRCQESLLHLKVSLQRTSTTAPPKPKPS